MREDTGQLERLLGRVLFAGSALSTVLLTCGLGMVLVAPGSRAGALTLAAGLMALIATPILRVIVSMVDYLVQRDWVFVALTLTVLLILLTGVYKAFRIERAPVPHTDQGQFGAEREAIRACRPRAPA